MTRSRQRLLELKPRLLVLQFGGASGTLAALGEQAMPIAEALAVELQLTLPDQPWHTQRDRLVEFGAVLGLIAGSLGKLGRDISLLMQTEAGEVFEPSAPGKGGSSTMPHKRNPVGAAVLIGAATRVPGLLSTLFSAMPQEHERSLGLWHAEWETLPEICCLVSGSLQQALLVADGLEVDADRMTRNLDLTQGLVLAEAVSIVLAQRVGRDTAHHLLEQCCKRAVAEQRHLRAVLGDEPQVTAELSDAELDRLLDPAHYLGQAHTWVERAVAEHFCVDLLKETAVAFVQLAEGELHYQIQGPQLDGPIEAPVLVLSNSLGTDLHMWDAQIPAFTEHFSRAAFRHPWSRPVVGDAGAVQHRATGP